jgi:hypothetical protein
MRHGKFATLAVFSSLVFWITDSIIHRFIYSEEAYELIPSDLNELWMRTLIVVLIVGFGLIADDLATKIDAARRDKHKIFAITVRYTEDVLNNLAYQLELAFPESDKTHDLDHECRNILEQSIKENRVQIDRLISLTELIEETIEDSVKPR